MKITAISDIHGAISQIDIKPCDVLCICGDVINLNDQRNLETSRKWWTTRFVEWVNGLSCDRVFVIPGNHDFLIEHLYNHNDPFKEYDVFKAELAKLTNNKLVLLVNESYTYKDFKFYGTPYINKIGYGINKWAFEDSGYDSPTFTSQCIEWFKDIPNDVDILLSHDSPTYNEYLNDRCKELNFKAHFYGHWHGGPSRVDKKQYNCSYLNDNYNVENKCITIEIEKEKDMLHTKSDVISEIYDELKSQEGLLYKEEILQWLDVKYLESLTQDDDGYEVDNTIDEDEYGTVSYDYDDEID